MFHNHAQNEEYVAESYNFESGDEEETVLEEEENIIITALFQAIEDGNQGLVEDLFNAYTIDINKPNFEANNGELILHVASGFGNASIVSLLIQNNAQINLADTHGDTAIHWAAREGQAHVVRTLYENGANVNLQNKSGETPIHLATRFDHVDTIRQLCKCGANVNLTDEHGETALHVASFFGFPKTVSILGEVGINTNVQNNDFESALHVAAVRGHLECVKCLLETGVNLNLLDKHGCTALHLSLRRNQTEIALILIRYKCNVEIKDLKKNQTALHLACQTNQKKVVDQLCKVGCNLNAQNVFNETPIHLAIKSNNLKIIRRLCAAGCDLLIKDSSGTLPKDLIRSKPVYEVEDSEEKLTKDEISRLINTLMDQFVKCRLINMLKPVLSYYDKCLISDPIKGQLMSDSDKRSSKNYTNCLICNSTIEATTRRNTRCCNSSTQCVRTSDPNAPCCNSINGVEQILSFKSTENLLGNTLNIPKHLLKFNLKVLGDCMSGKSTLVETLKCGYLASWFRSTNSTNKTNSSRSLNTNQYSSFNYSNKSNGHSDKTVLCSISTLISSKSSLGDSSPQTPHSNSAINSINSSTSILSINSDYLSSNNSSNLNLNNHLNNLNGNQNGDLNGNHHNHQNGDHHNPCQPNSDKFILSNNRKNSAINSEICNLKTLNKELSVSDGLHPFELGIQQDMNKFYTSFDLLDSRFGLSNQPSANHKLDCTLGISVQSINVPNVGDLTVFDFSGHQNYLQIYNKFLSDQDDAFYVVCFNACDSFDKQYTQTCYWLDLIKSVRRLNGALNFGGHLKRKMNVCVVATHRDLATKKSYNEINLKNLDKNIIQDLDRLNLRLSTSCLDNLNVLHSLLEKKYEHVFEFGDCIHLLDARIANSNEIKLIKKQLENYKNKFAISLQPITHFLEQVIQKLENLRKESFNSPIISYFEFVCLIRDQINLLVEDEHIEYACEQLEKLGEIIRLKNNNLDNQDLIIYDLKWLTSDVIGNLLSCSYLENNGKVTGHYCVEDLQSLFPDIDALDLFLILENLELCTPCETEGNFLYLFPCFIQLDRPDISWQSDESSHSQRSDLLNGEQSAFNPNFVYIGLRIQCDDDCYPKHLLVCLFPRIQILLERCFQQNSTLSQHNATDELKLLHWCNGARISYLDLEAIISLGFLASSLEFDSIEIKVRSSKENRADCFRLFELLVNLIEQYINSSFPNLQLQRSYYSPSELNCKKKFLYRYSTEDLSNCLFKSRLNGDVKNESLRHVIKNENCDLDECIADIISCGIMEVDKLDFKSGNFLVNIVKEFLESFLVNSAMSSKSVSDDCSLNEDGVLHEEDDHDFKPTLITDFTVHDLDVLIRQLLCKLFDPPDQIGVDWCMLSIKLNLTEKLPILDSKRKCHQFTSPTWRLLEEFGREPNCSLELLINKLDELNRNNAVELLFKSLPVIRIFPIKNSKFIKFKPLLAYESFESDVF